MNTTTPGSNPHSTASIAGHPIHPMLIPFPVASFVGALACDIAYKVSGDPFWPTASKWLLGVGIVMALIAALAGLTDFLGDRRVRALSAAWQHMVGNLVLVVLEAFNLYIRIDDPADTIPPLGLTLSAVGVVLLLFNGWKGWEMVYRGRVGIADGVETRQ